MSTDTDGHDPDPLEGTRQLWSTGSYATMGDVFAGAGRELVDRVGVTGLDVLDVACGTGNTTLAAVRAGAASVTGVDLTPDLLAEAQRRAEAEGLAERVTWHESDMAELPVPAAAFDRVLSTFGAMFATDQARVARELRRTCRPGGTVAVTAWTIGGTFDRMTEALLAHLPDAPPPVAGPRDWARPDALAAMFDLPLSRLRVAELEVGWRVPSAETAAATVEANAGPVIMLRAALGDRWATARPDLVAVYAEAARPLADGGDDLVVPLQYTVTSFVEPGGLAP